MRLRDAGALRAYVRLLGVSERQLARRAGVGHATVNHLMSGRRHSCRSDTAIAIEAALACPPGLFFEAGPVPKTRAAARPNPPRGSTSIPRAGDPE